MSRQSEISEVLKLLNGVVYCDEGSGVMGGMPTPTEFRIIAKRQIAEKIVDSGIGTKDRFEITQTRINYVYRNEIKAKVYEVENINKNCA